ncbi:MAG TPA: hemin uptake protein HemP [Pirellulaceae bacterium]|nr:hemin uptake protein HemP [Planctomycetales bacterium]MCB9936873.1 hemin uptake protein HemP [Planctomycetaceae bacterium]HRX81783.1 hemin uptake protein HemP [Pirellulaceae bacterium]
MENQPVNDGEPQLSVDRTDTSPRQWTSRELLEGHTEAIIVHAGEIYRLRCTRNNKLILHK